MLEEGHSPVITLFAEVDGNGNKEECETIIAFRNSGHDLVNTTSGGEGVSGYRHSE
jgi:hypothetical protein